MLDEVEHHQMLSLSCRGRLRWVHGVQFKNHPILILLSHWNFNYPIVLKARKVGMFFPLHTAEEDAAGRQAKIPQESHQ